MDAPAKTIACVREVQASFSAQSPFALHWIEGYTHGYCNYKNITKTISQSRAWLPANLLFHWRLRCARPSLVPPKARYSRHVSNFCGFVSSCARADRGGTVRYRCSSDLPAALARVEQTTAMFNKGKPVARDGGRQSLRSGGRDPTDSGGAAGREGLRHVLRFIRQTPGRGTALIVVLVVAIVGLTAPDTAHAGKHKKKKKQQGGPWSWPARPESRP